MEKVKFMEILMGNNMAKLSCLMVPPRQFLGISWILKIFLWEITWQNLVVQ